MASTLRSRDELEALRGLITAAMADCDAPGADAADREELARLTRFRAAVVDALREVHAESWHPDTRAMANWLAGEGPNPLTPLGHSVDWRTSLPEESPDAAPTAGNWMNGVLALAQPVAGRAPERYVRPHPVTPVPRTPARPVSAPRAANPVHTGPPMRTHAVPERDRIWLDVSYGEHEAAKRRGAVWDPVHRSWYALRPGIAALAPWSRLPEVLPGEDRTLGQGLFVDLIPSTSWFTNVRSAVSGRDWFRLRNMVYRRAGHRCEACGAGEDKAAGRYLECHERWFYRVRPGVASDVQVLRRLICLCSCCHATTHFGHTSLAGDQAQQAAMTHLMVVTGMDAGQATAHVEEAFRLWASRSERDWTVDLSLIIDAGIAAGRPGKGDTQWAS